MQLLRDNLTLWTEESEADAAAAAELNQWVLDREIDINLVANE